MDCRYKLDLLLFCVTRTVYFKTCIFSLLCYPNEPEVDYFDFRCVKMSFGLEDHMRCRKRVCIICYRKGNRSLAKKEVEFIQNNLIIDFSEDNLDFPIALCNGCHLRLSNKIMGKESTLPYVKDYDPERPQQLLRDAKCSCEICCIANSTIGCTKEKKKKGGRPSATNKTLETRDTEATHLVICSKSFSKIGKGYAHDCTRRGKVSNIQELLAATPTSAQRYASRLLSELDHRDTLTTL